MHYYQFNIGDYKSHTEHLSDMEDLAYRRMLDLYYLHEKPLPLDVEQIARLIRMRSHCDCITVVLREFFERTNDGWVNHRANAELDKVGDKSRKASESAKARWLKTKEKSDDANAMRTHSERNATQDTIHKTQNTKSTKVDDPMFDLFWNTFADKRSRGGAEKVWKRINPDHDLAKQIIEGAKRYVQSRGNERKFWKQAQGWLNDRRWEDDVAVEQSVDSYDSINSWENWT